MSPYVTMPLVFEGVPEDQMQGRAEAFLARMRKRRTVRDYSERPVPRELIETAVRAAGTAPARTSSPGPLSASPIPSARH